MKNLINKHYKNIIFCLIGTFINAIGVNCFLLGSNLGDGGTVGISLSLMYAFGLSPAWTSFIINTVVVFVGWKFLSKTVAVYTVISNTALSLFLHLTENINLGVDNFVINSLFGGAVIGIGAGLVISTGSTLGGTSVIAKIVNKYSEIKTSQGIFILDALVVLSFILNGTTIRKCAVYHYYVICYGTCHVLRYRRFQSEKSSYSDFKQK